jgi:amino acid transporter
MYLDAVLIVWQALYIFFKIYLRSKIIPLAQIDFQTELDEIREEKQMRIGEEQESGWIKRVIHWF